MNGYFPFGIGMKKSWLPGSMCSLIYIANLYWGFGLSAFVETHDKALAILSFSLIRSSACPDAPTVIAMSECV